MTVYEQYLNLILESQTDYDDDEDYDVYDESAYDEYDDGDLYYEGVNIEIRKAIHKFKKERNAGLAEAKKRYLAGDYKGAKKEIQRTRKAVEDYKEIVEGINGSWPSNIIGNIAHGVWTSVKTIVLMAATFPMLGIPGLIYEFLDEIKTYDHMIKMTASSEAFNWSDKNAHKAKALVIITKTIKVLKKMEDKCDAAIEDDTDPDTVESLKEEIQKNKIAIKSMKAEKKAKETTESTSWDSGDAMIAVYESAINGEITEEERDALLEALE